jgi:uncharacterized membrane protein
MKKLFLLMVITSSVSFISCSKDKDETTSVPVVDPSAPATFASVKKIMEANCIGCHSGGVKPIADPALISYADVKASVENSSVENNLIARISLEKGATGYMPKGGNKLPQASIDLIKKWKAEGYKE